MLPVQDFVVRNIYCSPSQDRQFSFTLVRVNSVNKPVKGKANVYGFNKTLPNSVKKYHVFTIGQLSPIILNLFKQNYNWIRDQWVKVSTDMVSRDYIFMLYNQDGVKYPSEYVYYSFIDERSLIFCIEFDYTLEDRFPVDSFKYIRVYSNNYFNSSEYNNLPVRNGIEYRLVFVTNNQDKVNLQTFITTNETNGGGSFVYVNGFYTTDVNLNIPNFSYVEVVYDQSVLSKETYPISDLRTFNSVKDNKIKYFLYRDKIIESIQYKDDNDIYITEQTGLVPQGLYYYQHADYAVRNVTDKDYSLNTNFVVNTALKLSSITSGSVQDKQIILYTRKSGTFRNLVYSNLKLHELYKLPRDIQLNTLLGTGNAVSDFRAETLENSDYFKVSDIKLKDLTPNLSTRVLGYNGITYYFANTPNKVTIGSNTINVPTLYTSPSTVFEYDGSGKFIGTYTTTGPLYPLNNLTTTYVEFLYGISPNDFGIYYINNDSFSLLHTEYVILEASFSGVTRLSNWLDITNDNTKVTNLNNTITLNIPSDSKVKIVYLNQPNIYQENLPIVDGVLHFPLTIFEDRGTGVQKFPIDVPYSNIEIYLNGNKLTQDLDFFLDFPYVTITNKKYLDYTLTLQKIDIRMYGFTLNINDINKEETRGFVNNGVLLRNKKYDIRDDRVISIYVDGKLKDRSNIIFAENDNTVRLNDPLNGLPYTVKEPFIAIKDLSGVDTLPIYAEDNLKNNRISQFFDTVFPEPSIDETNIISDHHYLYSPIVSKFISDILDGNIPSSVYTSAYDDMDILNLIDSTPIYKRLLAIEPTKFNLPSNIVEVHPHIGNAIINLNILQYRFITNVVRIITNNNPNLINLSGYLTATV